MICNNLFFANFTRSLLRSPGPPPLKHPGCGAGSGKVVEGEEGSPRHIAVKDCLRCQVKLHLHLSIHLGRQTAHLTKSMSAVKGFGSGPFSGCSPSMLRKPCKTTPRPLPSEQLLLFPFPSSCPTLPLPLVQLLRERHWTKSLNLLRPLRFRGASH